MKKIILLLPVLFLVACDDMGIVKAGSKVGEFTLVEDARLFNSFDECLSELKKSTQSRSIKIEIDEYITDGMYGITGRDPNGVEFLNTCSKSKKTIIMRIANKPL